MVQVVKRYTLSEVLKDKEFNTFLDGLMTYKEIVRVTLADHLIKEGWEWCDLDLDVEIVGGRMSEELGEFLSKYKTVHGFWVTNKETQQLEWVGHHGMKYVVINDKYYLEIFWGSKPWTVPYITLRERGLNKKKWLP